MLIDSLSFEPADAGAPWVAYRQFCEHFLAPARADGLQATSGSGRSCATTSTASRSTSRASSCRGGPGCDSAWRRTSTSTHAPSAVRRRGGRGRRPRRDEPQPPGRPAHEPADDGREAGSGRPAGTEWADYAEHTSYDAAATDAKADLVRALPPRRGRPGRLGLGANTGTYSRIAADEGAGCSPSDGDPAAAERLYRALDVSAAVAGSCRSSSISPTRAQISAGRAANERH